MDDEQRKYFADLMSSMEGVASDARAAASTSRETAATVRRLDARVGVVEGQIVVLHTHVFGKPPESDPPPRPIAESVTEHAGDIAELTGQVLAMKSELEKQSKKMQIDARGLWAFVHNTKVQDVVKLATLAAAAYAAFRGLR